MSMELLLATVAMAVVILSIAALLVKKVPRGINQEYFQKKWQDVVSLLSQPTTYSLAIIEADKLLDDVLKKTHTKGKSMGERLVSAQRKFSNNDAVWSAHKMRNKLVHETDVKYNESETRSALKQFQQALKDLGALK